jgi:hypothetical protein
MMKAGSSGAMGRPKRVRLAQSQGKMNQQSASKLREVGEGSSGGSGAWAGGKVCQRVSGGRRWRVMKWWQQAAFSKQRGGSDIDVQRKGGDI